MNADLSVAPEIAQLAAPFVPPRGEWGGGQRPHARGDSGGSSPRADMPPRASTVGSLAAEFASLAAAPERWWDLVRFDPGGPLRIPVPGAEDTWLLVLPPGGTADCDCARATLLAGEAAEAARPLRPGRVRVHGAHPHGAGAGHRVRGAGHGYSVTLHARTHYSERAVAPLPASPVPLRE